MPNDPAPGFDLGALHAALEAQRTSRGMSWQQVARAISATFARTPARPISASTLSGLRNRSAAEGDGILQMLRWLQRTPESFVPGLAEPDDGSGTLPDAGVRQILRFDTRKLFSALDAQRAGRRLTWRQVADEIGGIGASNLAQLSKGGRTGFPHVMRITRWLGRPAADFVRAFDR